MVPLERQLAEKLHAHTPGSATGPLPAKDLVDFILVRQHERVDAKRLKDAIQRTFARRGTHPVPEHLPESLRPSWQSRTAGRQRWSGSSHRWKKRTSWPHSG